METNSGIEISQEALLSQVALTLLPGIGDSMAKMLLNHTGSAEEIFRSKKAHLMKIPGIGPKTADAIIHHKVFSRAEEELRFVERYRIRLLFYTESNYPRRLKNCPDAPVLLYFKGHANFNTAKVLSVVGTRQATEYGKQLCRELISGLETDVLIVSGLAYGIDVLAHKEAVKHNMATVGVLGHGLDRIYPSGHRATAEKMLENGGLLTEFMSGTNPDKENFPQRNRIVAGIADATVIVEAHVKGGALITAEIANSYNRDVFTYPGRVNDEFSSGCNYLIQSHKAQLITSAKDLIYFLGWEEQQPAIKGQRSLPVDLPPEEGSVLELIKASGSLRIDELVFQAGLSMSRLAAVLLSLEMKGLIKTLPGKVYQYI